MTHKYGGYGNEKKWRQAFESDLANTALKFVDRVEGISGRIIEETVQWKDKRTTEALEKCGWTPPNRFSDGREVIHFDMEVFSGKGTYEDSNDYTLMWVWRWDGFSWIWDENKYTPEEALSKYPMKDFTWVSVDWEKE